MASSAPPPRHDAACISDPTKALDALKRYARDDENQHLSPRLPRSLKDAVEKLSREDGTSINQFVVTAIAEKVSAIATARFFTERKGQVDMEAFDHVLNREGGKPPRPGDELPE